MNETRIARFPDGFVWGVATASYQVEGAVSEGGRGPSIWDTFSHQPGAVFNEDNGDIASDHFHRFEGDLRLVADLGISAYRFSVAWSRVFPDGSGRLNQDGLDFYRRVLGTLRAQGTKAIVTLYHWDLPQALQDKGGWTNRDIVEHFGEYAGTVAEALGDEVDGWITLNEPWVSAFSGHLTGNHAPGVKDLRSALQAAHHLLLAHGVAVARLRTRAPRDVQVGISLNLSPVRAVSSIPRDIAAADHVDQHLNRWFLDPILLGKYPDELARHYCDEVGLDFIHKGDFEKINVPIDFLGVNYYTRRNVAAREPSGDGKEERSRWGLLATAHDYGSHVGAVEHPPVGAERTAKGWTIEPDGMYELLLRLRKDYDSIPIYVTENGASFNDYADPLGEVKDPRRIAYLRSHILAAHDAIEAGANLRGYFVWSLLDNFEWADGYSQRFGIVYVHYPTQARIPKTSAYWYGELARSNSLRL